MNVNGFGQHFFSFLISRFGEVNQGGTPIPLALRFTEGSEFTGSVISYDHLETLILGQRNDLLEIMEDRHGAKSTDHPSTPYHCMA